MIIIWDVSLETAITGVTRFLPVHGACFHSCVRPLYLFGDAIVLQGNIECCRCGMN